MLTDFTNYTINDFINFFGRDRDVYPEWYTDYIINPWVDSFIPEITWHADEIVENQHLVSIITKWLGNNHDIHVIGANRSGKQAYIMAGDHQNIYIIDIGNKGTGKGDYGDCVSSETPLIINWQAFRLEVLKRPLMTRGDRKKQSKSLWQL